MENGVENVHPKHCQCGGTGWIDFYDPVVGACMATRCPGPDGPEQLALFAPRIIK